jgi:hypothetical protein
MAITQSLATSFKVQILDGIHNFGTGVIRATTAADTFKIALYTSSATLGPTTTAYTTSNEVTGTGYTAGGNTLSISVVPTSSGTTAYLSFSNTTWASSTITARGALIYNSSQSNAAVAVFDFGSDKSTVSGDFTIVFPTADASNAVIRIA